MEAVLHAWMDGGFIEVQNGLRGKVSLRKRDLTLFDACFATDWTKGYPFNLGVKTSPRRRKLAHSGNPISFIFKGIKMLSQWRLNHSKLVLVALIPATFHPTQLYNVSPPALFGMLDVCERKKIKYNFKSNKYH